MTQPVAIRANTTSRVEQRLQQWLANVPRGQFWLFFTAAFFFNFGIAIFYFLFNLYLLKFGITERTLGEIGSLMGVGSIAGTIPFGVLAQRFGLRATLTGGILLLVAVAVLRASMVSIPAQLVLAVFMGLAISFWAVCISPAIAALTTEQQRPIAFSLIFASGIGVTGMSSLTAGRFPGWLHAHLNRVAYTEVRAMEITLFLSCVVALLALIPVAGLTLRPVASGVRLPRFSNPFLQRFLPAIAVWALVTGSFAPFANVYFVHHMRFTLQRTGDVLSFGNLVQFIAVLCVPLLFRKVGLVRGVMMTQLATGAALLLLALAHSTTEAALIFWIYIGVQNMNEPGIYSLLMDCIPAVEHNGASAATFFVSGIASALASLAMGAAIVRFGYSASMVVAAALAIVAAIVFSRLSKALPGTPQDAN